MLGGPRTPKDAQGLPHGATMAAPSLRTGQTWSKHHRPGSLLLGEGWASQADQEWWGIRQALGLKMVSRPTYEPLESTKPCEDMMIRHDKSWGCFRCPLQCHGAILFTQTRSGHERDLDGIGKQKERSITGPHLRTVFCWKDSWPKIHKRRPCLIAYEQTHLYQFYSKSVLVLQ